MIDKIGQLIECVTTAVKSYGILPHSRIVVRQGDFGPEIPIEHVKVGVRGNERYIILQTMVEQ